MGIVKIREKYQVTIPEDVREQIVCEVGEYIRVEAEDHRIVLTPLVVEDKLSAKDLDALDKILRKQKPGKPMAAKEFKRRLEKL